MHEYYEIKLEQDPGIDRCLSFLWKKDRYVTPECENYISAIQDQELPKKYLRYKVCTIVEFSSLLDINTT